MDACLPWGNSRTESSSSAGNPLTTHQGFSAFNDNARVAAPAMSGAASISVRERR
jgi:hypothetical protein